MQLSIHPHIKNCWPLGGIVITGSTPGQWLRVLNQLELASTNLTLYPLPGAHPHSVAGCLVPMSAQQLSCLPSGAWQYYQVVSNHLFIAANATLFPFLTPPEAHKLFSAQLHFAHPHFGWVVLPDPMPVSALFSVPQMAAGRVTKPHIPAPIPEAVTAFMIVPVAPEEAIEQLMSSHPQERMPHKPLNWAEKIRLALYELFSSPMKKVAGQTSLLKKVTEDHESLLERNQAVADKLLKMLRDNPAEALKYAIPIGKDDALPRGNISVGSLDLSKIWSSFSLFQSSGSAGGIVVLGDRHYQLMKQYQESAKHLEKQGAYQDAAFVYLKLLNRPADAAAVLERGNLYAEAAAVYLHHAKNKEKAALCYEKANMIEAAANIYKELHQYEKVGDMYASVGQTDLANTWYNEAANEHLKKAAYLPAALIVQHKMGNASLAQYVLLDGWNKASNPTPCLQHYFNNIADDKMMMEALDEVVSGLPNVTKAGQMIDVLVDQYKTRASLAEPIADIAIAVIARYTAQDASLLAMLRHFTPNDPELIKDAVRYKTMRGAK